MNSLLTAISRSLWPTANPPGTKNFSMVPCDEKRCDACHANRKRLSLIINYQFISDSNKQPWPVPSLSFTIIIMSYVV